MSLRAVRNDPARTAEGQVDAVYTERDIEYVDADGADDVTQPENAGAAVADAPDVDRRKSTYQTPNASPADLLKERSIVKRAFTLLAKTTKKAIVDKDPVEHVENLKRQLDDLYEEALAAHLAYCDSLGRYDAAWTAALDSSAGEVHQLLTFLSGADQCHQPAVTGKPAIQLRRSSRLQAARTNVAPLGPGEPGNEVNRQATILVAPIGDSTRHAALPDATLDPGFRQSTDAHRLPGICRAQSFISEVASSASSSSLSRGLSQASVRSASSQALNGSARSALSTFTRQRMEAELELQMIQKRREEDIEEEARLAELQRKLAEGKRRMELRQLERKVEEEVARLRLSENLARRTTEQPDVELDNYEDELTCLKRLDRREIRDLKPTVLAESGLRHDSWIRELKGADSEVILAKRTPYPFPPWNAYGAGFACTKPFDGDPREWPLFISRFRALVHNVISDDAQRVAILSDWLGPNVKRRVETLLTAPEGYVAALEYIQHQYGLPDKISRCRIKDLIGLPTCKTGDLPALQSFSDLLHGTVIVLQQAGNVHDLKSAANLEQIVQKLPVNIRSRWARLVLRLPRTPDLNDLDQLLQTVVDEERLMRPSEEVQMKQIARDAVFRSHDKPVKRQSGGPVERKRTSGGASATLPPTILATQLASNDACLGCGKPHSVLDCSEFKRKSANERAQLVKATGSCFRCLRGKHRSRECEVEVSCSIRGCKARHHTLLHGAERVYPGRSGPQRQGLTTDEQPQAAMEREVNSVAPKTIAEVLLAVVPVRVQAGGRFLDTHALLDNGSQATLIREDAARLLGLKGPRKPVRFSTFQGGDPTIQSQIVDFVVSSRDGSRAYPVSGAYVVPHLNVGNRQIECQQTTFQYLRDLVVPARGVRDVQLLIGMDVQDAHLSADVRRPPPGVCGPNALLTPFGWCLVGRCPTPITGRAGPRAQINHVRVDHLLSLESAVEQFWRTQSMPVCMAPKSFMALEDKAALEQLERTIRHTGERYEVGLPVKENVVDLPDNREAARRSFAAFERRMRNDDELRRAVSATMEETLRNGHAVKVPPDYRTNGRVWYLPYHAVRNPNKPGKVRLVYNAAARYRGMALNDVLRKGPDLTTLLLAVLLRFRERRIGVSADIRKMFYQVLVPRADRSLFRFLWRRPGTQDPVETYEMTVHVFGAVSSPAVCNFALQRLMSDAPSDLKGVAGRIASDFYVDNFLSSFDCEKVALVTCQGLTRLLNTGGFELAQFLSSSRPVIESLPSSIWVDPELDIDLEGLPTERTLGYLWNCQTDAFVFHFKSTPEAETKRLILAAVSSVFDPLGLVAPVVLTAKIILQDVWRLKLEWDETVPTEVLTRWHRWTEEIPLLEEVTVRRSHLTQPQSNYRSIQLHAFADASKDGYGAVIYIRAETDVGVSVTFAFAKARVAPIHQLSIPKLELQAALMAARLVSFYRRETTLPIDEVVLWSDASTVLRWLRSSHRRYITFVANRISEILDLTDVKDWRHVPGVLNPADELSRGLFPSQLDAEHRWFAGADFLYQSPECWPADIAPCDSPEVADEWLGSIGVDYEEGPIDVLIARSGNLHRLIRIVAWINRFAGNIRAAVKRSCLKEDTALNEPPVVVTPKVALRRSTRIAGKQFESDLQTTGRAMPAENIDAAANATIKTGRQQSADELRVARLTLIRTAQSASFPDEIARLSKGKLIQRESPLLTLSPFIDKQGHLRVGGRLQNSHLEYDARHQFILHPKHPLTRLLVRWAHICVAHHRAERTLAETRTRYWVLRGREAAKSIITRCFACAKDRASPLQPIMAAPPEQRVRPFQRPFSNTGVDYFGP